MDGCWRPGQWCWAHQTWARGQGSPECGERPRHPHRGSPMLFCLSQLTLKISGTQKVTQEAQLLPSARTSHSREVWRRQEEPRGSGNKQLILAERKPVDLSWKIPISLSPGQLTVHTSPDSLPLTASHPASHSRQEGTSFPPPWDGMHVETLALSAVFSMT